MFKSWTSNLSQLYSLIFCSKIRINDRIIQIDFVQQDKNKVAIVGRRWKLSQPAAPVTSSRIPPMDGIPPPPYAIPVSIAADESIAFIDDDLGGHNANAIPSVTEV